MVAFEHMQLFSFSSSFHFFSMELFRHSPSVWTRAHVSNELAERQRLWGEIHLAHTHMFSLTGPRKVMLNSIRHHERLMMLRGPHLTWDPVKLCLVVRCTCIDSSSVRGLIEWGVFFPSFFFNETCSSNEDQQNSWCLLVLGNHCPAPTWLTHCHSLLNQALWRQPKQMGLTYPPSLLSHPSAVFFLLRPISDRKLNRESLEFTQ